MAQFHAVILVFVVLACTLSGSVAKNHIVGSSSGWQYPPNVNFYQDWANNKTFVVGDRMVFPYRSGMYNLIESSKEDFPNCTQNHVVDMWAHGPVVINLTAPGDRYFYCGVGLHCEAGMKFHMSVLLSKKSAAPAPAPAAISSAHESIPAAKSSADSIRYVAPPVAVLFTCVVIHALLIM